MELKQWLWILVIVIAFSTMVITVTGCANVTTSRSYVTTTHDVSSAFTSIKIKSASANVKFMLAEDGLCRVECFEHKNARHAVKVEDGALTIASVDERRWYEQIGIHYAEKVTVYMPEKAYGELSVIVTSGDVNFTHPFKFDNVFVKTTTGNVDFCGVNVNGNVEINVTTGDLHVEDMSCRRFSSEGSTGRVALTNLTAEEDIYIKRSTGEASLCSVNSASGVRIDVTTGDVRVIDMNCMTFSSIASTGSLNLTNVIAKDRISVERSTGDVELAKCDATDVFITTGTGNVSASLRTKKIIMATTTTGKVSVPESWEGGRCKISTTTGDIKVILL